MPSSGIGAALARAYAAPGVRLALFGRDEGRARAVAEDCRAKGALVAVHPGRRHRPRGDGARRWRWSTTRIPLDLVIANAGVSGAVLGGGAASARLFAINVMGVVHTVEPAAAADDGARPRPDRADELAGLVRGAAGHGGLLRQQGGGAGLGRGPARSGCGRRAIAVSVICPGFVDTPLTRRNRFPMPMLMDGRAAPRALIQARLAAESRRGSRSRGRSIGARRLAGLLPGAGAAAC